MGIYGIRLTGVKRIEARPAQAGQAGFQRRPRARLQADGGRRHRHRRLARRQKYRAVARAVILGRPVGSPKPTPATIADRAISVASGNLQPMWEDLLEAVATAPPPPRSRRGKDRSRDFEAPDGDESPYSCKRRRAVR
jgi:hypothetical protein